MLVVDPRKRLTASEALKHPWMCDDLGEHVHDLTGTQENMREMRGKLKLDAVAVDGTDTG